MPRVLTLPIARIEDATGTIYAGALLDSFLAGTTTTTPVYSDFALTTAHANPVVADSGGLLPQIFLDPTVNYRFRARTSGGSNISGMDFDPMPALNIDDTFLDRGAAGDGDIDDRAAIQAAVSDARREISGVGPSYIYAVEAAEGSTASVTITKEIVLDGKGATVKPVGNTRAFVRGMPAAVATTSIVAAGATMGSRIVEVASATDVAVGQWMHLHAENSAWDDGAYPDFWAKVVQIDGTDIYTDRPLPVSYAAATSSVCKFYHPSAMISRVCIKNFVFDGSECTYTASPGQALRLSGIEHMILENCEFRNFDNNQPSCQAFAFLSCIDVDVIGCRAVGHDAQDQNGAIYYSRTARFLGNTVDGSGFGVSATNCEEAIFEGNTFYGRRKLEADMDPPADQSVRGLKTYSCGVSLFDGNILSDYDSPIKVEGGWRYVITGNMLRNTGLAPYTGQLALNVGAQEEGGNLAYGIIANNVIENCGGAALGVASDTVGHVIVANNQVRSAQGMAIWLDVDNAIISGNVISDWGLRNSGDVGIWYRSGATVTGNRFSHATLTSLSCLRNNLASGYSYQFSGNVSESGNPIFPSGKLVENGGTATIPSGSTSVTVAHALVRTPAGYEISLVPLENPTNPPGHVWVSSIGSSNFTIHCAANPGASNLDIAWRAALRMPFAVP